MAEEKIAATPVDVFISYVASEAQEFARHLADALRDHNLVVWFDEDSIRIGESISEAINAGISQSRSGVVLLSKSFLRKPWPKKELAGLTQRGAYSNTPLFPVLLGIDVEEIREAYPILCDIKMGSSTFGVEAIAQQIAEILIESPVQASASQSEEGSVLPTAEVVGMTEPPGGLPSDWEAETVEVDDIFRGESSICLGLCPPRDAPNELDRLQGRISRACVQVPGWTWPPIRDLAAGDMRWSSNGVSLRGYSNYRWWVRPNGSIYYATNMTNWYALEGKEGFGFQRILFDSALGLIFASRFSKESKAHSGAWSFFMQLRNAAGQPLFADNRSHGLSQPHETSETELVSSGEIEMPTSREALTSALLSATHQLIFPFTRDGRPPVDRSLLLQTLDKLGEANGFWDVLEG